ncbi:MAG TPA: hypothetical protein VHV32_04270 [Candidatus Angelobacter sp.]|jgi:hypothetical protein|nr:hypothetical protein [Candidatus Angelobacter sp.]
MTAKIISVDQMNDGVIVTFVGGITYFFNADFLYEQLDKRVDVAGNLP